MVSPGLPHAKSSRATFRCREAISHLVRSDTGSDDGARGRRGLLVDGLGGLDLLLSEGLLVSIEPTVELGKAVLS